MERPTHVPVSLNLNVRGIGHSATVAINERSDSLRAQGRTIFKLGLGQSPFPVPDPVVDELREHAGEKAYLPVAGLRELREAVARYHRERQGLDLDADGVLVGPGSKELMFLLQLAYYGDLLIPTPAWVSYAPQAHILGRQVRFLATSARDGWRITGPDLHRVCRGDPGRPRILVLNYPSNPTGATYEEAELADLAEVAARHSLVVLSDEIYGELHHEGKHRSIGTFYPEGTIVSGGLSKWCGAGGWRLGTFSFPPELDWLRAAMSAVASETYTSTSAPIQYAAIRAFALGPEIETYLGDARRILRALGAWCTDRLRAAGLDVVTPAGAFYLFVDFSPLRASLDPHRTLTASDLCAALLDEAGVAVLPGSDFGAPPDQLTARLAYVDFDGARALDAAAADPGTLDPAFLWEHCRPVLDAVERIAAWTDARCAGTVSDALPAGD
jgi:aspartate aminotransferase